MNSSFATKIKFMLIIECIFVEWINFQVNTLAWNISVIMKFDVKQTVYLHCYFCKTNTRNFCWVWSTEDNSAADRRLTLKHAAILERLHLTAYTFLHVCWAKIWMLYIILSEINWKNTYIYTVVKQLINL